MSANGAPGKSGSGQSTAAPTTREPSGFAIKRILSEIQRMQRDVIETIHIYPDSRDISAVHAIIEGPPDTPYSGGFFYFFMRLPSNYPFEPPNVSRLTIYGKGEL